MGTGNRNYCLGGSSAKYSEENYRFIDLDEMALEVFL